MSAVSVIVPVRDGERYLAEALESILGQTRPAAEVVVVDDGSTDGTAAVAARFSPRVRCVHQPATGTAAAINRGLRETGEALVASLDADDVWTEDKLELQVAALEADPRLDLVLCHVEPFHSPELSARERTSMRGATGVLEGYMRGAMLARRQALDRVGPFDERWRVGDFVDWHARAQDAGLRTAVLPQVLLRRRLHLHNSSMRAGESRVDFARVARATLRRRRAAAGEGEP